MPALTRRQLLTAAPAAIATALLPGGLLGVLAQESPALPDLSDWDRVRAQFALDPDYAHLASFFIASHPASSVTWTGKHCVELAADQILDELTRPSAHLGLDRIKPVVEKINSHLGCRLRRIKLRGIALHGVVSSPTLQRRMIRGSAPRRLRHT